MRVEHYLRASAGRLPDKIALVAQGKRLSNGELDRMSDRLATALTARGIAPGDRVAVFMDNCWEAVVAIFAVLKAGGVFSPVNPSTKADKLAFILENCRAAGVITQPRLGNVAAKAVAKSASVKLVVLAGGMHAPPAASCLSFEDAIQGIGAAPQPAPAGSDRDLAMLIYTSGSTGFPKGVMMTHRNIDAAATSITTYLENGEDDVILSVLPLSFDYGLYQMLMAVKLGATLVLERSFAFPQAVFRRLAEEKATGLPLVPTMAALILQMRDLAPGQYPHLRYLTNTAAALPPAHAERLRELFPSAKLFSMYGLTECKRCTYLPPAELDRRPGSVGIAIPGTEAYVVDERGVRVGPGIAGELVVRGPHVMQGYWENPEATGRALRPDPLTGETVLYTGDVFRSDEEGFLYFVGRKDDIIKTRGEKVSPKEVENVLYGLPGVREAAVIGVPDPILGLAVKAVIALAPEARLGAQDVIRHCARHLEDFMVPKLIEFREGLPKTDTGKISRRLVEAEIFGGSGMSLAVDFAAAEDLPSDPLALDAAAEVARIAAVMREQTMRKLRRRGAVIGLSGGIDSTVTAALAVKAFGPSRVLGLLMPEKDSDPESLRLGQAVADWLGIDRVVEDIEPLLTAAGCYRRRDDLVRRLVPEFAAGWGCKLAIANRLAGDGYNITYLVVQSPSGERRRLRMPPDVYLGIVAATNMKQRTRKQLEYYHADRLNYAVLGTPNRLEYDQGFFVKNGDGAADLKPIAHLYKSQVYRLAEHLGAPEEIRARAPSTDTWPLAETQEEYYFSLPYWQMDLCLSGLNNGLPADVVARATGLSPEQVARVWRDIAAKRRATSYLHEAPLLVEPVLEA